ncbi:GT4 family glycosyltransferase PelF [Actinacidiphila sp. ITFR-21]|uniref:GT4 family glycosyltransferase PelF n=1 Tax=Actinacidiphila sp. ITFR-21 TaxID=3075199 RepID=UPI00288BD1F2|nr:GT4 family glycosyltransferase PelF [Streptomyces sp. ITFR-21]WNI14548.1 GT4 family glycosyltransferase PelF [Streptomyces sp. ITFR-21]
MHAVLGGPPTPVARVTMLTEGTYPHSPGGVSVWCDQLVQGMPDVDFRVLAVTGTGQEQPVWPLPAQVSGVETVALWGAEPAGRAPRGRDARELLAAWEGLLLALLAEEPGEDGDGEDGDRGGGTTEAAPAAGEGAGSGGGTRDERAEFGTQLYTLAEWADSGALFAALRTEEAVRVLARLWRRPGTTVAAAAPTHHDALTATDLLEHLLRPLGAAPAPAPGGVSHAVSGGLAALPGLVAHQRHGTPLLLTEHGVYQRERYLGYRTGPYRWPVKALLLGFFRLLSRETYRTSALITPGNRYNRRWEEHGGAAPDRIRTVYNGVDPGAFPPAGPEPLTPTLTWAGRIDPIKDLETLIRAFALVREEIPAARLRIFGGTPRGGEAYRERCEALAGALGAGEAVTFEGRVDDIRTAYAAGQVVMLSSISEGFPFTLIEAMSCGRCTVSTDVGGVREAVGDTGLVVPPRDPAAMARAALELLRDPGRRAALGEAARLRVIERFTLRRTIDAFREIYRELGAAPRRPERVGGGPARMPRAWQPARSAGAAPQAARDGLCAAKDGR